MHRVRALSLWRPWSQLVIRGIKPEENRGWGTAYRGPLLIHATRSWDPGALELAKELGVELTPDLTNEALCPVGIVGPVDLTAMCARSRRRDGLVCDCSPWAMPGELHWRFANPRPLPEAIPVPGQRGLWEVDERVLAAIADMGVTLDG